MYSLKLLSTDLRPDPLDPLVVLLGPTAVGKTELSLKLAELLGAEIVSADSRLLYRGMDIGTAKPNREELSLVSHHLIDVANPDQNWSLAMYQAAADEAIQAILERGRLPILAGGTGQYIRAIVQGWNLPAVEPDPRLRQVLEEWGQVVTQKGLHTRLAKLDPEAAERIDPRNMRRTIRALEVILSSGRLFSQQSSRKPPIYNFLQVGLKMPRQVLYTRIDQRIETMLETGFIEEVSGLLEAGYKPDLPSMTALGYQEICRYLQGEINLDEARLSIRRRTRAYVRRQANWFKPDDPAIHWFEASSEALSEIHALITSWLSKQGYA